MKIQSLLIFFCILTFPLSAKQFGKNKVQYKNINWRFIQTTHFDIYFYRGGEAIAEYTADVTEEVYQNISSNWDYKLEKRIPILIYSSHNDFQQSLVVQSYLDEGIGGVTELFKNRIIVPYEGSYKQFRHVIYHELVHAVMNDMLYGGTIQSLISKRVTQVPLWFAEGLAEWESVGWDTKMDMYIRDAVINNSMPPLQYLNYYLAYQGGANLFKYISTRFGREKVRELMHKVKGSYYFGDALEATLGLTPEKLSEDWHSYLRKTYWPEILDKKEATEIATRLTEHEKEYAYINNSPSFSPNGDKIAYISNKDTYMSVYIMNAYTGKDIKMLLEGNTSNDFEELHFLSPGMSWSPDGQFLAFSAKGGDQDYLYIVNVENEAIVKHGFELDGVFGASWSPDGSKIAFIGNADGSSDIYLMDTATEEFEKLTNDVFSDIEPSWSPDGKNIIFASDRDDHLNDQLSPMQFKMQTYKNPQYDIYEVRIEDKYISRVTNTEAEERSPTYSPDGTMIAFVSDRNGVSNIFYKNVNTNEDEYPVTNLLTGAYQLDWSTDGKQLMFTSFFKGGWDIYSLKNPLDLSAVQLKPTRYIENKNSHPLVWQETNLKPKIEMKVDNEIVKNSDNYERFNFAKASRMASMQSPEKPKEVFLEEDQYKMDGKYKVRNYQTKWSLDFINLQMSYDNLSGVNGLYALLFSDISGSHNIELYSNFVFNFRNSNILLRYAFMPHRLNYIFSLYHYGYRINAQERIQGTYHNSVYHMRNYGFNAYLSYPINKFNRLDIGADLINFNLSQLSGNLNTDETDRQSLVTSMSYNYDNILWGSTGPVDGTRFNATGLLAPDVLATDNAFATLKFDFRNYQRFGRRFSFASRLTAGSSVGIRSSDATDGAQIFRLGGVNYWLFNTKYQSDDNGGSTSKPDAGTLQQLSYTEFITPLRGAEYNTKHGRNFALLNLEMRFPFIDYLIMQVPPIPMQGIRGAAFLDIGSAFDNINTFRGVKDGATKDLVVGYGFGVQAYVPIFGALFRTDVAWRDYGTHISKPQYYFSFGADF